MHNSCAVPNCCAPGKSSGSKQSNCITYHGEIAVRHETHSAFRHHVGEQSEAAESDDGAQHRTGNQPSQLRDCGWEG